MGAFQTITNPSMQTNTVSQTPQPSAQAAPVSNGVSIMPQGKGGSGQNVMYSATSAQPSIGMPNKYSNTVQYGDNTNISGVSRGKGI